jgi:hypothetical protein
VGVPVNTLSQCLSRLKIKNPPPPSNSREETTDGMGRKTSDHLQRLRCLAQSEPWSVKSKENYSIELRVQNHPVGSARIARRSRQTRPGRELGKMRVLSNPFGKSSPSLPTSVQGS